MKAWYAMTPIEKYTKLLRYADAAIVEIEDAIDRDFAEYSVKRALMYALLTHAVPRDEAIRSAEHRREYIRQHYADVPAVPLPEDELFWDNKVSLDQLAEREYEMYS